MKTSEQIDQILPALAEVKANLTGVKKGTKNTFFKSSYADLNTHLEAVEELLEQNGLLWFQPATNHIEGNVVSSRIYHVKSGQFVESSMKLIGENDMQKAGSAVTYARRYTLGALLSMQAVDDDGNVASGKVKPGPQTQAVAAQPTKQQSNPVESKPSNVSRPSFRDRNKVAKSTPVTESAQETQTASGDDL